MTSVFFRELTSRKGYHDCKTGAGVRGKTQGISIVLFLAGAGAGVRVSVKRMHTLSQVEGVMG